MTASTCKIEYKLAECHKNRARNYIITDIDGSIVTDVTEKMRRWREYLSELFQDEKPPRPTVKKREAHLKILWSKVEYAINTIKTRKAPGPDQISIDMIKFFDDHAISILLDLFNFICEKGENSNT